MNQRLTALLKGSGDILPLLFYIFVTELAIMELLYPLFSGLGVVRSALVDAGIVVVIVALPLWRFFQRVAPGEEDDLEGSRPAIMLGKTLVAIFMIEYLMMLLLPHLLPNAAPHTDSLVDALLTALCSAAPLLRFLYLQRVQRLKSPQVEPSLRLYILLLCTIFLSDLSEDMLFPFWPERHTPSNNVVDAFVTTVWAAPLFWLLVVRPLRRAAQSEKKRVSAVHAQVVEPIVTVDPQGSIRTFNPAAETVFGFRAKEMIGAQASLLFAEGEAGLADLFASATALPGQASPAFNEVTCRRRDGESLVMGVSISVVLLEGSPEFLLIMRDITTSRRMEQALRDSEQRFRDIFDQSEDAILFFRPGGSDIVDLNAKTESTFGYGRRELLEGGLAQIVMPEDLAAVAAAIGTIGEVVDVRQDFAGRRKNGEAIVVSLRGKVMALQDGPVTYCTLRDITERVRMDEKSREIQAKLIETNKMTSLGLLVSGVAHEINNPNNFIMANSELLEKVLADTLKVVAEYREEHPDEELYLAGIPSGELAEHSMRLVRGIVDGSRRVNDIVNNLKDFARYERRTEKRDLDLNQVARAAVSLLNHELTKYTHHFNLELCDPLPPVKGHAQQLGQVIINLLMNACQALPSCDRGIWLSTLFDQSDNMVRIVVRDEGCGISREGSQRILEPFFTTKLDKGGTGLGLAISESIVREHGGQLEFSSEPGRGTTFSVGLPAAGQAG
ncbi:PAS domain S-box protein [Geomonas sp. Red32]|uniref:PAS domain-containing sensor histidine kinase n=1 Tax=Geomonas sp. Red32 TaxID=2912856 RepID=UPI00202D0C6D|nr:PAS domain S-box protein [Geomonas sp. Red32]MCM0083904.1 PAS domain S-box protein [Geomonas sp. Red32]